MSGTTSNLSRIIVEAGSEATSPVAADVVKRSIIDWIGCAFSGSRSPNVSLLLEEAGCVESIGPSTVLGKGISADVKSAAWINGFCGHIDDFDDSGNHPASYLTPALLAVAEDEGHSGARVISAWVAGYELASRLTKTLHPDRAWHMTSVIGALAAASAVSVLIGSGPEEVSSALGIATSQASGVMRNFGTPVKALHPGNAARTGVEAARLARRGFGADSQIIEGKYGLFDCFAGEKGDLAAVDAPQGARQIELSPPVIKAWPTCTGNHRSITAILDLVRETAIDPSQIERVDHFGWRAPGTGPLHRLEPESGLEAKFSLSYNIAAALLDRDVTHATFGAERFSRGDIQDLMTRIRLHMSNEASTQSSRTREGVREERLLILMTDGARHSVSCGSRRTLAGDEVIEKFHLNAGRANVSTTDREALARRVADLESIDSCRDFFVASTGETLEV